MFLNLCTFKDIIISFETEEYNHFFKRSSRQPLSMKWISNNRFQQWKIGSHFISTTLLFDFNDIEWNKLLAVKKN